jgi:acetyl-CoA synthetase
MRFLGVADWRAAAARPADPAGLMQQVIDFCDFRFFTPYTQLLDTVARHRVGRWCVGGTTNIVLNCLDRHRGTPTWDQVFLVWEGEDPPNSAR